MTPILYEKDEIDFTSQGLGSLVEIYDVDVAEQRNGLLQLTASYPVTGVRYSDISVGRIILAKPNQRDEPHAFRITSTDLDIMGHNVMIEADSITYDLNHNIVKHVSVNGQSGQAMMTALQMAVVNPSIFTFYSDITHVSSTSLDYVNPMEAVMGVKGSFLQIWGGELKRENRRVAMFNRRGRDNVATFRLGKNISGLKYKVDISSLVTRILPIKSVQENDTTTYLEGTPVSSQYINSYEQIYTIKVDFTDDTIKTVDDLNKASANWFVDSANTARDKPSVTIDIDVLSLQDSADYQDKFKDLESVALTDTVTVYVPEYGINVTAIVNELHFDPIQERVTKLTVGTAKQSFADSSRTQLSDLQDKIISVQNQADATAVSANGKSTNYYGSVEPSHPQEGDTWFWVDGDKSGIKVFVNGEWVDQVDSDTQEKIAAAVDDAVKKAKDHVEEVKQGLINDIATAKSQAVEAADLKAKDHVEEVKQGLVNDIETAKSNAVEAANAAQQNAIDVASKSLGTYLVRLLPGTNIFKTTNSTTIQAQVWKAGQDITSTLDSASFSWKIAKDGNAAISLTNNVKNVTAKTSDFNSIGTYIVNVIIPVTDTTGTTRNQTFSDSTTIAKVADGTDGTNGQNGANGAPGPKGTDGRTSYVHVAYANSADGTSGFSTTDAIGKSYIGVYTDFTESDSSTPTVYTWSLVKGQDGSDGIQGPKGADGISTYVHFAYANSSDGRTSFSVTDPTGRAYVGTLTDTTVADSTDPTRYTWSLIKGADGATGATGNGISSTTITYATSSSGTNAPTSGYTSTIPTVNNGQFLWQRTETSYTNGTTKNSYVVTYFAKDGLNGVPGMDGGQGMIAQPTKPTSGLVDGFLWLDTSQTYPVYYIYDSSIKDFKIYQFNAKNISADQIKAKFVGTGRLSASEIIADDLHVKSANIDGKLTASQITVSSTNGSQTSLANFNLGEMSQTISDNGTIVNKLNQNNLVNNSQLNPDYSGWHITSPWGKSVTTELWNNGVESKTGAMWVWHDKNKSGEWIYSDPVAVLPGVSLSASVTAAMPNPPSSGIPLALYVYTYDANKTIIDSFGLNINYNMVDGTFKKFNLDNRIASSGAKYASVAFGWIVAGMISFGKPMLMFGTTTGDYVAGPYNNNDKIASQQITIDGINNFVRDSSGNLSSSFQTALSKTSLITGSTLASSIQTQTSSQISSALRDNNGKIISLINQDTSGVQISGKNITLDGNTTFTNLQNNVNSLGQVNLINNSNFLPDYSGWHVNSPWGNNVTNEVWNNGVNNKGAMYIWHDTSKSSSWLSSEAIPVSSGMTFSAAVWAAMPTVPSSGVPLALLITYYDANQKELSNDGYNIPISSLNGGFKKFSVENRSTPSGAKYVALRFGWSTAGSISFGQPMLVMSSSVGDYVAGAYNNNAALTQVKNTADGISNFVRDSSGNISSSFQTALSKTSLITGSTLASSIQTQTATQISSALTDNNGKIISLINQDSSGVQIAGKNIVLDGDTTVTGTFWAKQVNAIKVDASYIKVGTLNGSLVNITNINADNIVSGAISGANLNINLNTGSVVFQKGRINSSDYTTDINIDQGYISTANGDTRALLTQGKLQLIDPTLFSPQTNPYLEISNRSGLFNGMGALITARDSLTMSINGYGERLYDTPMGTEKFVGLSIGKSNNKLMPTKISGAEQGVIISGGKPYDSGTSVPYIYVGSDSTGAYPNGDRIYLNASYFHSISTYVRTTSGSANVVVSGDGALVRSSSARKYKLDIKNNIPIDDSLKLIEVPLSTWVDKHEHEENGSNERYFGMIAEDLCDAGLEYLVQYGEDNEVEGINYDRVTLLLIPLVKELKERIEKLESKGK